MTVVRSWVIGTAEDCDVRVEDEYASGHHCRVSLYDDGEVTVSDLGSSNGTWVLAGTSMVRVLTPMRLRPGWKVRVGRTDLPWRIPT